MSITYDVYIDITGHKPENAEAIADIIVGAWPSSHDLYTDTGSPTVVVSGYMELTASNRIHEVADGITHTVWRANKAFCRVLVGVTYIENAPYDALELEKCDYDQWLEHEEG